MSSELKPCPFCGGVADIIRFEAHDPLGVQRTYIAQCANPFCRVQTLYHEDKGKTERAWNKRSRDDE